MSRRLDTLLPLQGESVSTRRDLAACTADGVAFSVMVGVGEAYVCAFALLLGASDVTAGLLATVPLLAGALLQLVSPAAIARIGSLRRWVVCSAAVQAMSLVPLVVGGLVGRLPMVVVFAAMTVYWAAGLATGPAWNTWVESLVPSRLRAHYFALRSRLAHGAALAGLVAGGLILQGAEALDVAHLGFAITFGIAVAARLASSWFLSRQSEPEPVPPAAVVRSLPSSSRLLTYMVGVTASVQVAAPFFAPYMLGPLGLDYVQFMTLIAAAYVSRVVAFPAIGRFARRWGARRLLVVGGLGIVPISVLWALGSNFYYLLFLQVLSGLVWAIYELATFLLFFEAIPRSSRLGTLTIYNVAHAVAVVVGSLVGGAILSATGQGLTAYLIVFAVSSLLRGLATLLLWRVPASSVGVHSLPLRPLSLRPSAGALERPVLSGVPEASSRQ